MSIIDACCPLCLAAPGEPCFRVRGGVVRYGERTKTSHHARVEEYDRILQAQGAGGPRPPEEAEPEELLVASRYFGHRPARIASDGAIELLPNQPSPGGQGTPPSEWHRCPICGGLVTHEPGCQGEFR